MLKIAETLHLASSLLHEQVQTHLHIVQYTLALMVVTLSALKWCLESQSRELYSLEEQNEKVSPLGEHTSVHS